MSRNWTVGLLVTALASICIGNLGCGSARLAGRIAVPNEIAAKDCPDAVTITLLSTDGERSCRLPLVFVAEKNGAEFKVGGAELKKLLNVKSFRNTDILLLQCRRNVGGNVKVYRGSGATEELVDSLILSGDEIDNIDCAAVLQRVHVPDSTLTYRLSKSALIMDAPELRIPANKLKMKQYSSILLQLTHNPVMYDLPCDTSDSGERPD